LVIFGLVVWASAVLLAINAGVYEDMGEPPLLLLVTVAAPIVVFGLAYAASANVRDTVLGLDPRLVIGAQSWRVVGAVFLFALAFGRLPAEFAIPAGWGDIATGVAALPVLISLTSGTLTRVRLYAFTALGAGDFLAAIIAGLSLRPHELDLWPLVIFPTIAVPFFSVLHLIAILQFRARRAELRAVAPQAAPVPS
jgi:hypothetical protein